MRHPLALLMIPALLLIGCATQTPYQPAEKRGAVGFTETQLTDNRYRIVFTGNSRTDAETVQDYALLRAAELTLETGHDWFQLAHRDDDKNVRTNTSIGSDFVSGRPQVFQRCGLLSCDTFVSSSPGFIGGGVSTTTSRTTHTSQLEIVVGKGPLPEGIETYDAKQLSTTLRRLMNAKL